MVCTLTFQNLILSRSKSTAKSVFFFSFMKATHSFELTKLMTFLFFPIGECSGE